MVDFLEQTFDDVATPFLFCLLVPDFVKLCSFAGSDH